MPRTIEYWSRFGSGPQQQAQDELQKDLDTQVKMFEQTKTLPG